MNHLEHVEAELRERLTSNEPEALVTWVKERILESYRNGQKAGRSPRRFRGKATSAVKA
jgi:hypothetical protein